MTLSIRERALQASLKATSRVTGASVTYSRGATSLTITRAIPTDHRHTALSEGTEAAVEVADWLIEASQLTLGTPAVGDTIARVIGGTTHTYSVECPSPGVLHYEISETYRGWFRVHTREDGTYQDIEYNDFDISGDEVRYP